MESYNILSPFLTKQDIMKMMLTLEHFIFFMYDRTTNYLDVNNCRQELSVKKGNVLDYLPPTTEALVRHTI